MARSKLAQGKRHANWNQTLGYTPLANTGKRTFLAPGMSSIVGVQGVRMLAMMMATDIGY